MNIPSSFSSAYYAWAEHSSLLNVKDPGRFTVLLKYIHMTGGSLVGVAGGVYHGCQAVRYAVKSILTSNVEDKTQLNFQCFRHRKIAVIDFNMSISSLKPSVIPGCMVAVIGLSLGATALFTYILAIKIFAKAKMAELIILGLGSLLFAGMGVGSIYTACCVFDLKKTTDAIIYRASSPLLQETKCYFDWLKNFGVIREFTEKDINNFDKLQMQEIAPNDNFSQAISDFNKLRQLNLLTNRDGFKRYQNPLPDINAAETAYSHELKMRVLSAFERSK